MFFIYMRFFNTSLFICICIAFFQLFLNYSLQISCVDNTNMDRSIDVIHRTISACLPYITSFPHPSPHLHLDTTLHLLNTLSSSSPITDSSPSLNIGPQERLPSSNLPQRSSEVIPQSANNLSEQSHVKMSDQSHSLSLSSRPSSPSSVSSHTSPLGDDASSRAALINRLFLACRASFWSGKNALALLHSRNQLHTRKSCERRSTPPPSAHSVVLYQRSVSTDPTTNARHPPPSPLLSALSKPSGSSTLLPVYSISNSSSLLMKPEHYYGFKIPIHHSSIYSSPHLPVQPISFSSSRFSPSLTNKVSVLCFNEYHDENERLNNSESEHISDLNSFQTSPSITSFHNHSSKHRGRSPDRKA